MVIVDPDGRTTNNMLQEPFNPKFHSVSLYGQPLSCYRPFWIKCTKWPQNNLEHQEVKGTPYTSYKYSRVPEFGSFCSTASQFQVTGHFETSAPNDLKWPWTIRDQRYPIYILQLPLSPKFHSNMLYGQPLSHYRPFWDKSTKWPHNDLRGQANTKRPKLPNIQMYMLYENLSPKFRSMVSHLWDIGNVAFFFFWGGGAMLNLKKF